jgi:hypothetical protein
MQRNRLKSSTLEILKCEGIADLQKVVVVN